MEAGLATRTIPITSSGLQTIENIGDPQTRAAAAIYYIRWLELETQSMRMRMEHTKTLVSALQKERQAHLQPALTQRSSFINRVEELKTELLAVKQKSSVLSVENEHLRKQLESANDIIAENEKLRQKLARARGLLQNVPRKVGRPPILDVDRVTTHARRLLETASMDVTPSDSSASVTDLSSEQ